MPEVADSVKTRVQVQSEFGERTIPAGTVGTIVDVVRTAAGEEAFAVDIAIPNAESVTGFDYDNVLLTPDLFEVVRDEPE